MYLLRPLTIYFFAQIFTFLCTYANDIDAVLQDPNSPKDVRIADGLGEIGPSVCVGAATTLVGIMPMIFARNHVFQVFLKMFLIIIGFGVSLFPPGTYMYIQAA